MSCDKSIKSVSTRATHCVNLTQQAGDLATDIYRGSLGRLTRCDAALPQALEAV